MERTIKNISLYIKRAEQMHTKEYIISAFEKAQYGKVKDVKFIEKQNESGVKYNGAIVFFELWFANKKVIKLFNEMQDSKDGIAKIFHDELRQRYWYVMEYTVKPSEVEECTVDSVVDTSLSKDEQIAQLTKLVRSLTSQLHYFETTIQKNEQRMMEHEQIQTYARLVNEDYKFQLFQKELHCDLDIEEMENREEELKKENKILKEKLLVKEEQCAILTNDLYDKDNMLHYFETNGELGVRFLRNSYN